MKIDRKTLCLVVPIYGDDDDTVIAWVHIQPLAVEVFEQHFKIISKTISMLYSECGISAPRVASLALKDIAVRDKMWPQVQAGLVAEMHRGAMVIAQDEKGAYQQFMWDDAVARGILSPEDAREVDSAIVFFTLASSMHTRAEMADVFDRLNGLWQARKSSSTPMEFANSLRTPTAAETTPAKPAPIEAKEASFVPR